jgi:hypothetical protein
LIVTQRDAAGSEFSAPTVIETASERIDTLGSAAISGDCRTLYYVSVDRDSTVTPPTEVHRVLARDR